MRKISIVFSVIAVLVLSTTTWSQDVNYDYNKVLSNFVGEWEGTGILYYPRDTSKTPRVESITASCKKVLKDTYIVCESSWKRKSDGRIRNLITYWNYDAENNNFQILYLYDNWPGIVNYTLKYNPERMELTGSDTFTNHEGLPAKEKVVWIFSEDGNEIRSQEFNQFQGEPEDYWALSFEFVWKRK